MVSRDSVPKKIVTAIKDSDLDELQRLLAEHPEQLAFATPFGGQTWLGYAAQLGNLNAVKALVAIGADVNQGDPRENTKAIDSAAAAGHPEVVRFLIEQGAEIDVSASVRNPLFAAIVGRSPEIVDLLLQAGVDARIRYNSKTMEGMDATAFALMRGERECALRIVEWNCGGDAKGVAEALAHADMVAERNARKRS